MVYYRPWITQQGTRLEAVCRRLVTTNDTMDNIASSCGFPKLDRLRAAFKGKYGMTMPEYRAQAKAGH